MISFMSLESFDFSHLMSVRAFMVGDINIVQGTIVQGTIVQGTIVQGTVPRIVIGGYRGQSPNAEISGTVPRRCRGQSPNAEISGTVPQCRGLRGTTLANFAINADFEQA